MIKKGKKLILMAGSLFLIFVLYTLLVKFIDVKAIGPNDSKVGLASLNQIVHRWFPLNLTLYNVTDWGSILPIGVALLFAILGLVQLIKRKKIRKVDGNILALGICYLSTFIVYVFFEFVVVNRRPVLLDGILEASYPSSTTMLSLVILVTCIDQVNIYIQSKVLNYSCKMICIGYALFLVIGRIISGVHWASDIIGAMIVSAALIISYFCLRNILTTNGKPKEQN